LICFGFIKGYTKWTTHEEGSSFVGFETHAPNNLFMNDKMYELLYDAFGIPNEHVSEDDPMNINRMFPIMDNRLSWFFWLSIECALCVMGWSSLVSTSSFNALPPRRFGG